VEKHGIPEAAYIKCLINDLETELPYVQGRELHSIFIGGGTPSLFSAKGIAQVLDACANQLSFARNIEITMEANPGSSEQRAFADLCAAGVNRLSLGIQSFNPVHLQTLGRVHDHAEALAAVNAAQQAGFQRINLDIMHGLPAQTPEDAMADLQQAVATGVGHISWYQLTIEQNTEFFRYPPALPVEDTLAEIQEAGFALLEANGFKQYEISAFAKNGQPARHNLNYWQFGDYLAIGAGAHGKITLPDTCQIIRYRKTRLPKDYMSRTNHFGSAPETIAHEDILFEGLMNCLRLNDSMNIHDLLLRTGSTHDELHRLCQPLLNDGLLEMDTHIKASPLGRRYLNTVLERLLDNDIIM
jgi:oxygen-independent coproporphyrinogen-3 oxidase